jgi:hydrogenase-4 component F
VLRVLQVFRGQDTGFVAHELLIMGCLSLTVAAVQVMAARNYKRLIAYACVSSSGVIAIGLSVGKAAAYGVVLYVVSNAFVKALLFLTAGRLRAVYRTNEWRRSAASSACCRSPARCSRWAPSHCWAFRPSAASWPRC